MARSRSESLLVTVLRRWARSAPTRRADRRGADDDPARRQRRQHDDAHAGQRLRAGRRILLHRRSARRSAGAGCALLRDGAASDSQFNVVTVETGGKAPVPAPRLGTTTSRAAGSAATTSIEALCDRLDAAAGRHRRFDSTCLAAMPDAVLSGQGLFSTTGAVHAAAAFTADGRGVVDPRGRRSPQRGRQGGRPHAARRRSSRPRASVCSSAAGPASSWCRRRGRPASARWSPSAHRRRSPCRLPGARV